jgi:UDP-N-acetyl-D-glucosamine/UDP-N-acetyl-D-galactosamine dehydrogenase
MNKIKISIIGVGYVGLPLALEFGKKFETIGIEISKKRLSLLNKNLDPGKEIKSNGFRDAKYLKFSNTFSSISNSDFVIVTIPTPINNLNKPDLNGLKMCTKKIATFIKKNTIIVYESTFFPGLTEEICIPLLKKYSKLKFGKDFFVGYSPERINPGDKKKLININKLVSASHPFALKKIYRLYKEIINAKVIKVKNIKIAETAKVFENVQRDTNIALANELSMMTKKLNINTLDVIDAAATKWNFARYVPGLVGGHCISVDPYYLTYKSKKMGFEPKFINLARKINNGVVNFLLKEMKKIINKRFKKNAKILVLGLSYKENVADFRNSKAIEVAKSIKKIYPNTIFCDPLMNKTLSKKFNLNLTNIKKINQKIDLILLLVPHKMILSTIMNTIKKCTNENAVIMDIKSVLKSSSVANRDVWML